MYINEKEIWLVNLNPTKGIEMQKICPCLILPITSTQKNGRSFKASASEG